MCIGSKSSNTSPPPPKPATTFDYQAAQRSQSGADARVRAAQSANVESSTAPQTFGSELATGTS